MKILFDDVIQYAPAAPSAMKSPALCETCGMPAGARVYLDKPRYINCIGMGNTAKEGKSISAFCRSEDGGGYFTSAGIIFTANGLYELNRTLLVEFFVFDAPVVLGRFAAGLAVNIPTAVAKQPGFNSTAKPRVTMSGQVVPGLGGYEYRTVGLDSRYQLDELAIRELENGYYYTAMGYPFFIYFDTEKYKLPFERLYANEKKQQSAGFEGGVIKYLYSRRWEFEERF